MVSRPVVIFWGLAAGVALTIAALAAAFLPYEALGLQTVAERERAWLLTVWTAGAMSILFALSSITGAMMGIGVREVVESGSVRQATDMHRRALRKLGGDEFHRSFDWWLMCTGGLLILIYFAGWVTL